MGYHHHLNPRSKLSIAIFVIQAVLLLAWASAQPASQATAPGIKLETRSASLYQPNRFSKRAAMYYGNIWGIDSLTVRATESGELIRFSYRVIEAHKAGPLNDKNSQPTLIDFRTGVELVIPSLEKVGQLRQSSTPEEGKIYWMAFSNPGRRVKRGDRVEVHIGLFKARGLIVD